MLKDFESNILKNQLFTKDHSLLVAISGGADSVVLARLLKEGGYQFNLAHCNFKLRGKESEADEKFCRDLAKKNGVKIFVKQFDVEKYCKQHGVSTQMAARDLRYSWFKELMRKEKFDRLLTAHHANDVIETVLMNLLRGTGIKGLKGVPVKNGNIVRPLLYATKEEIGRFAKKEKIKFRKDKSNEEDKYTRNYIRLKVIPKLKKINPNLEHTFIKNSLNFYREGKIVEEYVTERLKKIVAREKDRVKISRSKLKDEEHPGALLHHLLSLLNFSDTQQENILSTVIKQQGEAKQFLTKTHKLVIDRNDLVIVPAARKEFSEIKIAGLPELKKQAFFTFSETKKFYLPAKDELFIERQKLVFPLAIRRWKAGDRFRPFGMKGYKLLSDFIKDEKISAIDKEQCKVLVNGNEEIIWLIGYRSDERYRVDPSQKHLVKLSVK